MTTITNFDSRKSREAQIITKTSGDINWCIAVWPAPDYGRTKIDGNGHGWQIVRRQDSGKYTYNKTMMGGFVDSLEEAKEFAASNGYEVI